MPAYGQELGRDLRESGLAQKIAVLGVA